MNRVNRGRTLLIVEDNRDVRAIFSEVFQTKGYRVLEAENGREAYDLMIGSDESVSVVLTDLRMPVMDGLEFARLLKNDSRFFSIPIVLLSATPLKNSWGALEFFDALLVKPCSFEEVVSTVDAAQQR
ncbi:response regulator [Herbaspirillum seropedicae]|uniref:response regulator n=1 Tax=Herbaspirillum seropedicae TaxID=964 RepID=UPI0028639C6F|nr:response regulator [Herbaspirillum seropedicae]MDR6397281.1 CheY-like chemotaxis protein [Herbaspirillum seropedicae]